MRSAHLQHKLFFFRLSSRCQIATKLYTANAHPLGADEGHDDVFEMSGLRVYAGAGKHLEHKVGLWIDRREARPGDGEDVERVREGMGLGKTLAKKGYVWMQDKISWSSMVFRLHHQENMAFNTPSLQSAYHRRYWDVVKAKTSFIIFHDAFELLELERGNCRRSALILQLLADLRLQAIRMDAFEVLARRRTSTPLRPRQLREACQPPSTSELYD